MAALNKTLLTELMKKKSGGPAAKVPAGASKVIVPPKKKTVGSPSTKPSVKVPATPKEGEQLSSQQAASSRKEITVSEMIRYLDADPTKDFILPNQEVGSGAPMDSVNPPVLSTDSSMKRRTTKLPEKIVKKATGDEEYAPAVTAELLKETPQSPEDKSMPGALIMQIEGLRPKASSSGGADLSSKQPEETSAGQEPITLADLPEGTGLAKALGGDTDDNRHKDGADLPDLPADEGEQSASEPEGGDEEEGERESSPLLDESQTPGSKEAEPSKFAEAMDGQLS